MIASGRWARVPPFERGITLGDFLVPIRVGERAASWQRHLLMITAGTLLIILGARISFFYLPGNPLVPVTLQTFGVLFGSALLGFRRSLLSVGLYLLLGVVGLPIFAWDEASHTYRSGLETIVHISPQFSLAPTGGYLIGFLLAGGLVGRLAELGWDRKIGGSIAAMLLGNAVIYLVGIPWLMASAGLSLYEGLGFGLWDFVPGDLIKVAIAAGLLPVGWWFVRRRSSDL